jgi:scyllo-inositol 2-dehydrogenase (NADP+)
LSKAVIRVGLLAYGAIGDEHNLAASATDGLQVVAVCDGKADRIEAALKISPDAKAFADADLMLASGLLDLVIISTPPNTHFDWAMKALNLGINVIVEKPMALTADQCDQLIKVAKEKSLLLVVYQNRRYDSDFLTIQKAVSDGLIGEVFSVESFVGGYAKPCSFWHSDALISGGAIFDWGAHFIDQIITLINSPIDHISGVNQKRHWHHVTNADHAQVVITYQDGRQALFINSDLAAVRKPKYLLLGTKGSLIGNWDQSATTPADLPAIICLHRADGSQEILTPVVASPHAFHTAVAKHLLQGEKMPIDTLQSRDVVAIMQAAEKSAAANAVAIKPALLTI